MAVTHQSKSAKVVGGIQIVLPALDTMRDWCEFHGIQIKRGIAIVFKGVGDDYKSVYGASYKPGEKPEAADWKADDNCGHGLHFSPHPVGTLQYAPNAKRFLACPVKVDECVVISDEPRNKIKAPRVVGNGCVEVNLDGIAKK